MVVMRKKRKPPRTHNHTLEEINFAFELDWYTWKLRWKIAAPSSSFRLPGQKRMFDTISTTDSQGYLVVTYEKKRYYVSHIIWMLTHEGRWPQGRLKYLDGNKFNNKPSNLKDTGAIQRMWEY